MEFTKFIRRPFTVEAVIITEENMKEIAKLVGDMRTEDGVTFIRLDRRIIPNMNRAYIGWYFTRLGDNYRCYSPNVFLEQFVEPADEVVASQSGITQIVLRGKRSDG
jgi:hypothetical protein